MTSREPVRVVVIGGGVTGLTAAYAVHRARPDVIVELFEARSDVGGNIRTEREDGFVIDAGPDSFIRTKPEALALCRELGLEEELVPTRPVARHVFVAHAGKLERMPGGMALAVPTRIEPLLQTKLLSAAGKARILAEPFVPRNESDADESIEEFFERRVGKEAARRLAGPLLGGIYAGNVAELSIRSTFPQLVRLEVEHGSLLRGFVAAELARDGGSKKLGVMDLFAWLRRSGEAQAPSPFLSLRGGMGTLIDALRRALPDKAVQTNLPIVSVRKLPNGSWQVETGGRIVIADAVIVATPAHVAARISSEKEVATELAAIPYVSTATVFFGLDRARVAHDLQGFGFIVPPGRRRFSRALGSRASGMVARPRTTRAPSRVRRWFARSGSRRGIE